MIPLPYLDCSSDVSMRPSEVVQAFLQPISYIAEVNLEFMTLLPILLQVLGLQTYLYILIR